MVDFSAFQLSRRTALQQMACGVGGLGLATLLADEARAASPGPHHPAKAKSLIFLNMQGGPTQFETFDYKPEMAKYDGMDPPVSNKQAGTVRLNPGSKITAPLFKYLRHPKSEVATTEVFPRMAEVLDELCAIRTMQVDSPAHPQALTQSMTGYARQGMPSFGSWIMYGLGSANKNLPGFVYLAEPYGHGSSFLPADFQGMPVGDKVPNLKSAAGYNGAYQRDMLDALAKVNANFAAQHPAESALNARIEAAELAFRMQTSGPEVIDLSKESKQTLELYAISGGKKPLDKPTSRALSYTTEDFSTKCLIARRLVERGVRVVTIGVGGRRGWDQHGSLRSSIEHNARVTDAGIAALITDLKRTGLLESTIVMWGGEFGRTPYAQGKDGRDHFAKGFTYWLAGGGAKKGVYYGETDETGSNIVKDPVHIHDLHATVLHLMGLDHQKLTYKYAGRDQTLTDVNGQVVKGLIA